MIDLESAIQLIRRECHRLPSVELPIDQAAGSVLAADVVADLDAPPFDKSMMDGYALVAADVARGTPLRIVDELMAGSQSECVIDSGNAAAIMTGAPIPRGADAVVIIEQTARENDQLHLHCESVRSGQNILKRASLFRRGDVLLPGGKRLLPSQIGLIAESGRLRVPVHRRPTAALITTGSELCPADQIPAAGKIRNTNGPLLLAMLKSRAGEVRDLGIADDQVAPLTAAVRKGLSSDLLVLTGGVSMGALDLVPQVLADAGVRTVFHKVAVKPGKPVWFGVLETSDHRCLVFGLPGNPVSSFVCFLLFVTPAIQALQGVSVQASLRGRLVKDHHVRGDRPTYWPSCLEPVDAELCVRPLDWAGSADQRCLAEANCLVFFPEGDRTYRSGEILAIVPLDSPSD